MPTYKLQRHTASSYSNLQRDLNSEMKQEPPTTDASVYDFSEGDPKPYLHPKGSKAELFGTFFNYGQVAHGKQGKRGNSLVGNSKKKPKLTAKKLPRKKSQRIQLALEASSNRSSSASDLIEADSDSESNQDRRNLETRFGGELGISCLNTCRNEDYGVQQSQEVVIHGRELRISEQCFRSPSFMFTVDGIVLKIGSTCMRGAVKWALDEIESFRTCFDEEKGLAFIKLSLTDCGVRTFLQALGQSEHCEKYLSCQTLLSSVSSNKLSWDEDMKKITSLSDGHKFIWKPLKEDMSEFFQDSGESSTWQREDPENLDPLVDHIALDRDRAMSDNWSDLIFPTKDDHDAVTVTQYDFLLLNPDQFLSDTIVDFYIKFLQSLLTEEQNRKCYFYNTFFFRKLTEVDKIVQTGLEKRKSSFDRVKRWTAKINIFERDYLFIPIMQSAHWSLAIVCHPGSLSTGCQDVCDSKVPVILHFDSLEGCHTFVEEPIRKYLIEAWNEKNGPVENLESLSTLKFVAVKAPQQTNYSDCGLFLLHYVELFIRDVVIKGSIDFAFDEWFEPADASSKRGKIQSIIEELKANESAEKPEKSCFHTSSNVTGPLDEAWSAQRLGLLGEEHFEATNLFSGNMLDEGCSMLVSYPQQYQNDVICGHTKFEHDHLQPALDLQHTLATVDLQQHFCHGQSEDDGVPSHDALEDTENLEDFHALGRHVRINLGGEFAEGLENDASVLTVGEEICKSMKADTVENKSVDAGAVFGFSLHYNGERVSDMSTSTVQKFASEEKPCGHAFQEGNESPEDGKEGTNYERLTEQAAKSISELNEAFIDDLEPKIWLSDSASDINDLEGKAMNTAANKCAEDGLIQSETETCDSVATPREALTEHTYLPEVSGISSPVIEEKYGLDRLESLSSDEGLTVNATEGLQEGKRGRQRLRSKSQQVTPASTRVTRSASKRRIQILVD